MDFKRMWTRFAVDAEVERYGVGRIVEAHNAMWEDAVSLARAVKGNCTSICTCSKEYRDRRKQDPGCEFCEIGKFLLPLADKILKGE